MLSNMLEIIDKLGIICKTFKLDLIISVIVNLVIIAILFKLTDVFIKKLKSKNSNSCKMKKEEEQ